MNNNKQRPIECIKANETVQEFYECMNDTCPICNEKIITPTNLQKIGSIVYHLNCYLEITNKAL